MKTVFTWFAVGVWFLHLTLAAGAGYAALRLWPSRDHPLVKRVGIYLNGFIVEAVTAALLVIAPIAKGVQLTWKFAAVMFVGALLADLPRLPLIVYIIKGPAHLPPQHEASGDKPPQFWLDAFRQIVREEVQANSKSNNTVR